MCEQIFKKTAPNTIQSILIVKNRSAIIAGRKAEAVIKNKKKES